MPVNPLYYEDNPQVLRDYTAKESVDLICHDPPFNSKRDHNLLFGRVHGRNRVGESGKRFGAADAQQRKAINFRCPKR